MSTSNKPTRKRKRSVKHSDNKVNVDPFTVDAEIKKLGDWSPHTCVHNPLTNITDCSSREIALLRVISGLYKQNCQLCQNDPMLRINLKTAYNYLQLAQSKGVKKSLDTKKLKAPQSHLW